MADCWAYGNNGLSYGRPSPCGTVTWECDGCYENGCGYEGEPTANCNWGDTAACMGKDVVEAGGERHDWWPVASDDMCYSHSLKGMIEGCALCNKDANGQRCYWKKPIGADCGRDQECMSGACW